MKKYILGLALLAGAGNLAAQITISQWDLVSVGSHLYQAQDTMPAVGPGSAGPNQTWVMTNLDTATLSEMVFTNPSWTPEGQAFPNSNLEVDVNNGDTYIFLDKNANALEIDGVYRDFGFGPMTIENDDPEVLVQLILNYQDTYSDVAILDERTDGASAGLPVDSARLKQHHDRTYVADAWGTLTTPVGTFDVLRQRIVDVQHDTIWVQNFGFWTVAQTSIDTNYNYAWWTNDANVGFPLVEMSVDANDNPETANWLTASPTMTDIVKQNQDLTVSVFPNPAENVLQIDVNFNMDKVVITDLTGKVVLTQSTFANKYLGVDHLKTGVYFVSVYANNKVKTLKFVKK